MPIKVVVSGTGKMGRQGLGGRGAAPAALFPRTRPDVVVDFTNAEYTPIVAREALEAGARLVIGTSGLSEAFLHELDRECRERKLGAVVASNFALGAVVMTHLAKAAARFFDHVELIEMHHEDKTDAPSGTAITTARKMAEGRKEPSP